MCIRDSLNRASCTTGALPNFIILSGFTLFFLFLSRLLGWDYLEHQPNPGPVSHPHGVRHPRHQPHATLDFLPVLQEFVPSAVACGFAWSCVGVIGCKWEIENYNFHSFCQRTSVENPKHIWQVFRYFGKFTFPNWLFWSSFFTKYVPPGSFLTTQQK